MNTTTTEVMTELPSRQTRAERMRQPLAADVVAAVAEQHGVCVRPFTMEVADPDTGELRYVPMPCGSTVETCAAPVPGRLGRCGWPNAAKGGISPKNPCSPSTSRPPSSAHNSPRGPTWWPTTETQCRGPHWRCRRAAGGYPGNRRQTSATRSPGTLAVTGRASEASTEAIDPRRQDAPNLPTRQVRKTTLGREFAGRYRPSMFLTLTCDSYGRVRQDGTPVHPESYDYRRAARDAVHFASLVDRWWQNLRRVVGWEVQYFATVEPQRRAAPHLHTALRGSIPHDVIRQVTAATYHQVWWPAPRRTDLPGDGKLPVWEPRLKSFTDPDTRQPLTSGTTRWSGPTSPPTWSPSASKCTPRASWVAPTTPVAISAT